MGTGLDGGNGRDRHRASTSPIQGSVNLGNHPLRCGPNRHSRLTVGERFQAVGEATQRADGAKGETNAEAGQRSRHGFDVKGVEFIVEAQSKLVVAGIKGETLLPKNGAHLLGVTTALPNLNDFAHFSSRLSRGGGPWAGVQNDWWAFPQDTRGPVSPRGPKGRGPDLAPRPNG